MARYTGKWWLVGGAQGADGKRVLVQSTDPDLKHSEWSSRGIEPGEWELEDGTRVRMTDKPEFPIPVRASTLYFVKWA